MLARAAGSLVVAIVVGAGCSRTRYRLDADREAYHTIAERNGDPRWQAADYSIEYDPRSRYFDRYRADCSPMPPDDPASGQYMRHVNGMKGWKHWWDNGVRREIENPQWRERLGEYLEVDPDGTVHLDVDGALRLAYVHSPSHQSQLETLYLSSLDVTTERFRLDTQYFGGYDLNYAHRGRLNPPSIQFDGATGKYIVTPAASGPESNRLALGRSSAANPSLQLQRKFATAGQLITGFANSIVFEFTGDDANLSSSLINVSFLQPLLRGAGRDVALEQLTFDERTLLANLRSYAQFRQGFYTQIAVGELGVSGPQRFGRGTALQIFSGQAGLGGYVGLLQQLQQIRNSEDNLSLQLRTLAQLEALLDAGLIDLVQVDQFRQNVENERANLLQSQTNYLNALDRFKTNALGLPPDLKVDLDDSLIGQFQLVDRRATGLQDDINDLQDRIGASGDDIAAIQSVQTQITALMPRLRQQLDAMQADLQQMKDSLPQRIELMESDAAETLQTDVIQLNDTVDDLESQYVNVETQSQQLQSKPLLDDSDLDATVRDTVILLRDMLRVVQGSILVQARSRLEAVTIDAIELSPEDAFQIALANRLDFMNGRAALVDSWRLIQVNADALQSVLNVTADGEMRTARNNPFSFRAPTSTVQLGLQFDAPLTRLVERNNYREALINYQRSRRDYIQSRDNLNLGLRILLRQVELLRVNLEIQRRAVAIAIRRVDLTRSELYAPVPPPRPGQRAAQFGPTSAINLLSAQSALRDTQNSFLGVWLNYYAAKMRLARELGIMELDPDGRWIEQPLPKAVTDSLVSGLWGTTPPADAIDIGLAVGDVSSSDEGIISEDAVMGDRGWIDDADSNGASDTSVSPEGTQPSELDDATPGSIEIMEPSNAPERIEMPELPQRGNDSQPIELLPPPNPGEVPELPRPDASRVAPPTPKGSQGNAADPLSDLSAVAKFPQASKVSIAPSASHTPSRTASLTATDGSVTGLSVGSQSDSPVAKSNTGASPLSGTVDGYSVLMPRSAALGSKPPERARSRRAERSDMPADLLEALERRLDHQVVPAPPSADLD